MIHINHGLAIDVADYVRNIKQNTTCHEYIFHSSNGKDIHLTDE